MKRSSGIKYLYKLTIFLLTLTVALVASHNTYAIKPYPVDIDGIGQVWMNTTTVPPTIERTVCGQAVYGWTGLPSPFASRYYNVTGGDVYFHSCSQNFRGIGWMRTRIENGRILCIEDMVRPTPAVESHLTANACENFKEVTGKPVEFVEIRYPEGSSACNRIERVLKCRRINGDVYKAGRYTRTFRSLENCWGKGNVKVVDVLLSEGEMGSGTIVRYGRAGCGQLPPRGPLPPGAYMTTAEAYTLIGLTLVSEVGEPLALISKDLYNGEEFGFACNHALEEYTAQRTYCPWNIDGSGTLPRLQAYDACENEVRVDSSSFGDFMRSYLDLTYSEMCKYSGMTVQDRDGLKGACVSMIDTTKESCTDTWDQLGGYQFYLTGVLPGYFMQQCFGWK